MNPFKRIKIGDRILALDCIESISLYCNATALVCMTSGESWKFADENVDLLKHHVLLHWRFIEVHKSLSLNINAISSVAFDRANDTLGIWLAGKKEAPLLLGGYEAKNFWRKYSERTDCLDLAIFDKPLVTKPAKS